MVRAILCVALGLALFCSGFAVGPAHAQNNQTRFLVACEGRDTVAKDGWGQPRQFEYEYKINTESMVFYTRRGELKWNLGKAKILRVEGDLVVLRDGKYGGAQVYQTFNTQTMKMYLRDVWISENRVRYDVTAECKPMPYYREYRDPLVAPIEWRTDRPLDIYCAGRVRDFEARMRFTEDYYRFDLKNKRMWRRFGINKEWRPLPGMIRNVLITYDAPEVNPWNGEETGRKIASIDLDTGIYKYEWPEFAGRPMFAADLMFCRKVRDPEKFKFAPDM